MLVKFPDISIFSLHLSQYDRNTLLNCHVCFGRTLFILLVFFAAGGVIRHLSSRFQGVRHLFCGHALQLGPSPHWEDRRYWRLQTSVLPVSKQINLWLGLYRTTLTGCAASVCLSQCCSSLSWRPSGVGGQISYSPFREAPAERCGQPR